MVWIASLIIIGVISFFLTLRSMKDYQESPEGELVYSLNLLKDHNHLPSQLLKQLYDLSKVENFLFSIERLMKGEERVVVLYLPDKIKDQLTDFELVEIEDYVLGIDPTDINLAIKDKQISLDDSFSTVLIPHASDQFSEINIKQVLDNQYIAIQFVLQPALKSSENQFQSTIRLMVKETHVQKRVELVKHILHSLSLSELISSERVHNSKNYEDFKKRAIIPEQIEAQYLSFEDLNKLI